MKKDSIETITTSRAKSITVGLNWYLNSNVRLSSNFVQTDFTGAMPCYRATKHEDGLIFRALVMF